MVLCMMFSLAGCNAITIDGEGEAVENARSEEHTSELQSH